MPGGSEWMLVALIAVLLFGAGKLPKLARSAGSAIGEFKKARHTAEEEVQKAKEEVVEDPLDEQPETMGEGLGSEEEVPEAA